MSDSDRDGEETKGVTPPVEPGNAPIQTPLPIAANGGTLGPEDAWSKAQTTKQAELDAKVAGGQLSKREAVHDFREFDAAYLADQKLAWASPPPAPSPAKSVDEMATEHAQKLVEQAKTMRGLHTRFEALGQNPIELVNQRLAEHFNDRHDPSALYRAALKEQRDDADPYGTLERTAMAEHAMFQRGQQEFADQIEKAPNLAALNSMQQKKDVHAADYLASTSQRIADQSEIITGRRDNVDAVMYRERAAEFAQTRFDHLYSFRDQPEPGATADEPSIQLASQPTVDAAINVATLPNLGDPVTAAKVNTDVGKEWSDAGIEMTEAKLAKLDRLADEGGLKEGRDQPTRSLGGGAEM